MTLVKQKHKPGKTILGAISGIRGIPDTLAEMIPSPGNAIMFLELYKTGNVWLFDDLKRNIIAEPFVAGMNEIIDAHVGKKTTLCQATFSANPFPQANTLVLIDGENMGGWYRDTATSMEGWLCPVVKVYFGGVPEKIYYSITYNNQNHEKQSKKDKKSSKR